MFFFFSNKVGCLGSIIVSRKFEPTVKWLRRQRKNAAQAIRDLKSGQKIESEGIDLTDEWISRYEQLLERYARLIETYEQRDREAELTESLRFKE